MTHVLVTGGAGFIGSHLVEALLARGYEVTAIDDLSTGSIRNLDEARKHKRFSYYIDSVMNERLMAELIDRADMVYHLAAAVGVRLIVEKPVHTIETNIRGTEIVLELAARKRKTVLITSTSEVYGKSSKVPFNENDDLVLGSTTRPRWAYACSKAIDEFLGLAYYREFGMPVVIVRLFNTVGPRQTGQYGMVVPRFVTQALKGEPLTVYGDGTQTRAFAYVGDVVEAMIALTENSLAYGQVFNIGNDKEISIAELAQLVIQRTASTSPIEYIPFEKAYDENFEDLQRRVPDLTKVRKLINYTPKVCIEEIIDRVAASVRSTLR
ncbi:MAG: GDP-mannose 4,6-dehydratase [Candidatus Sumerlaeaceae bacterium]|nr:GDP-mannose 4,6-dehydratase [Candidatus Sumerlaeaceae bacterium]